MDREDIKDLPDRRDQLPPAPPDAPPAREIDEEAECPHCGGTMRRWAAFYRCPNCGYKESCCF